jgi:hypothetical protein
MCKPSSIKHWNLRSFHRIATVTFFAMYQYKNDAIGNDFTATTSSAAKN